MASDPRTGSHSSNHEEPQGNNLQEFEATEQGGQECGGQEHGGQHRDSQEHGSLENNDPLTDDQQTKCVAEVEIQSADTLAGTDTAADTAKVSSRIGSFLTVGIGASAGGLQAFQTFFRRMDESSGMAFVLISHLAPDRDSLLSELLAKETQMPVLQVTEEVRLQPNKVCDPAKCNADSWRRHTASFHAGAS